MKKKYLFIILVGLFVITGGAAFPIYNFGKHYADALKGIIVWLNIVCYMELGMFECKVLPNRKIHQIALFNFSIIFIGLVCRYLLEFGEISNTYNFTLPNTMFHIIVTLLISVVSYIVSCRKLKI